MKALRTPDDRFEGLKDYAFGADMVMVGVDKAFQTLPGAQGQPHTVLPDAGHFLQEDVGDDLADLTNAFIDRTS